MEVELSLWCTGAGYEEDGSREKIVHRESEIRVRSSNSLSEAGEFKRAYGGQEGIGRGL